MRERIDAIWAQTLDESANIDRALEAELGLPPTPRPNAAELNVHALRPDGSRAEVAAFWMLLFLEIPTYATLMNLRLDCWIDGDLALKEWICRQYATVLLHGSQKQRDAIRYSLWVDYFEDPVDAPIMFARLLAAMPFEHTADVLLSSGPIPWSVKREAYMRAVRVPSLHAALATGLVGSFYDFYGQVDAFEARALFQQITVEDADERAALIDATTEPLRLWIYEVDVIDDTDPQWAHPGSFVMAAVLLNKRRRWVYGAKIHADGLCWGRLVHYLFPSPAGIAHRAVRASEPPPGDPFTYRVEGDAERATALVGRVVEAWPEGLGPQSKPSSA